MTRHLLLTAAAVAALSGAAILIQGVKSGSEPAAAAPPPDHDLPRYRAGGIELGVATVPAAPRVGANRLIVELRADTGAPVSATAIDAVAEMPTMGAMAAMRAPAELVETAPGRYEGSFELSMRGEWPLTLSFEPPSGEPVRLRFDLATDRAGLVLTSGGAALGGGRAADADADAVTVDHRRRQLIGIATAPATHRDLVRTIRAVGRIAYDERRLSEVALKYDGYIGELAADYVGAPIAPGQVLFTVYSPELLAAQQEYLQARRRGASGQGDDPLLRAARQRLRLWDLAPAEIAALEQRGEPLDQVPIRAPRGGTLIARQIAAGSAAARGQTLLAIADLSQVWVEAQVFEADLELVHAGMTATVTLPDLPGQRFETRVDQVYPTLEASSRTGRVRLTLANAEGALKPEMYAEVKLVAPLGHRLAVPEEAVIVAGDSRVVFVDLGDGRLRPVHIQTGRRADGYLEVRSGLGLGDRIVTSGNFLLAAETRLKTGLQQW